MVTLFLRPYLPRDRPACLALLQSNTPPFFALAEEREFKYWLDAQEVDAPGQHYYVAEQAGELVACGGFFLDGVGRATLTWGMVASARHRQGMGRQLLAHRLAAVQALRPGAKVVLDTTQHAALFFERFGFRVTAITPNFYFAGVDRYDMEYQPGFS